MESMPLFREHMNVCHIDVCCFLPLLEIFFKRWHYSVNGSICHYRYFVISGIVGNIVESFALFGNIRMCANIGHRCASCRYHENFRINGNIGSSLFFTTVGKIMEFTPLFGWYVDVLYRYFLFPSLFGVSQNRRHYLANKWIYRYRGYLCFTSLWNILKSMPL